MSGAADIQAKLYGARCSLPDTASALVEAEKLLADAWKLAGDAARAGGGGNSLEASMNDALAALVAAEATAGVYKAAKTRIEEVEGQWSARAKAIREALAEALALGSPPCEIGTHSASGTAGGKRLVVEDITKVPTDLIEFGEPKVKAAEAKRRLARGPVPGLRLEEGKPGLRIETKRGSK